ncbi:MAG: hypothetical protein H6741_10285 [Alphaproteobacteria bacterium]|nr:hypothetical protein [Alphaproteobacteria bacterium]
MDAFRDALKGALSDQSELEAKDPPESPAAAGEDEPDPHDSDWVRTLAQHVAVPRDANLARLRQLSDVQVKALKGQGRKREARELADLRDAWIRQAERRDWGRIKARFDELGLPDKAYRALKQERGVQPARVLQRLNTRASEGMQGASAKRVRDWLLG